MVEGVVGTAIMGTMLASMVLASGKMQAQSGRSARRLEACRVADKLLTDWWAKPSELPHNGGGDVPNSNGLKWRTKRVPNEIAKEFNAELIALELYITDGGRQEVLTRVELILPEQKDEEEQSTDAG